MKCDATVAQNAAQRGHLVVVGWRNPKPPAPGHVAIVLGRDRISQAGATNHFVCTVKMGFGDAKPLVWYVQMGRVGTPSPHSP
jgi:cell wall-associated NlpC family hydrolase